MNSVRWNKNTSWNREQAESSPASPGAGNVSGTAPEAAAARTCRDPVAVLQPEVRPRLETPKLPTPGRRVRGRHLGKMRRLLKWIGRLLAATILLAAAMLAWIYFASERVVQRSFAAPSTPTVLPPPPGAVELGRRLAKTRGCTTCHGDEGAGRVFIDARFIGRIVAPSLTRSVRERSDAEFERIVRHGIFPDGRSALFMPSSMFQQLADEDLAAILAYLRSLSPSDGPKEETSLGLLTRLGLATGEYAPQAARIDHQAPRHQVAPVESLELGRYLALTACTECHGADLEGGYGGAAPDLRIVAGYPPPAFGQLMRTGTALGGRELPTMSKVAQGRFRFFSEAELQALRGYLQSRAGAEAGGD